MSRETRDRVWTHSASHGSRKELLLWLAERADKDGVCWPGLPELQDVTGLKERSVQVLLKQLEEDGEIYTPTSFGRGHTPIYIVTVGWDAANISRVLQNHGDLRRRGAVENAPRADQIAAMIVARMTPQKAQNPAPFKRGEKAQNPAPFREEKAQNDCIKGAKSLQEKAQNDCNPFNKDEPSIEPSIEPSLSARKRAGERESPKSRSSSGFDGEAIGAIYRAYPRLVGRPDALKAIARALGRIARGEDAPEASGAPPPVWPPPDAAAWLLERTARYAAARADQDERFTPHPATWFNGARYSDDEATWKRTEPKGNQSHGSHSEYLEDLDRRRADLQRRKRELGLVG